MRTVVALNFANGTTYQIILKLMSRVPTFFFSVVEINLDLPEKEITWESCFIYLQNQRIKAASKNIQSSDYSRNQKETGIVDINTDLFPFHHYMPLFFLFFSFFHILNLYLIQLNASLFFHITNQITREAQNKRGGCRYCDLASIATKGEIGFWCILF